jgi:hypothetical protein
MLLAALDAALLVYSYDHWRSRVWHCLERCGALVQHYKVIREYGQGLAMSRDFAALVYESFPWNEDYRGIGELRDLRQFIIVELQKAYYVDGEVDGLASVEPDAALYHGVEDPIVVEVWKRLLCGCVDESVLEEFEPLVATWESESLEECTEVVLTIDADGGGERGTEVYNLPLVWDRDGWVVHLATQEWWPDLHRCVELHHATNRGIQDHPEALDNPLSFGWSRGFSKSLLRFCTEGHLRERLVEALTKRVYGVLDGSLGDEPFGGMRRFRVTDFWRVHYRQEEGRLILQEFGPHDIGGAS